MVRLPQVGIKLFGEPGTGKSSLLFAYKVRRPSRTNLVDGKRIRASLAKTAVLYSHRV